MSSLSGICAKCLELKTLTRHHVFPRKRFKHQNNAPKCFLCQECHSRFHSLVEGVEGDKGFYLRALVLFLKDELCGEAIEKEKALCFVRAKGKNLEKAVENEVASQEYSCAS